MPFPFLAALPLIGKIVGPILGKAFGIIDQLVPDKDLNTKLKSQIQMAVMTMNHSEFIEVLKAKTSIIISEAKSGSWLARSWRPMIMCLFGVIIFNNYVFYPYLSLFFEEAPVMEIPDDMWSLLKIGLGGYVVGRSAEKILPGSLNKIKHMFGKGD